MPGQTYQLRFKNRSNSQHDFLVFQQGVDVNRPEIATLAWFAKPVANGADVDFTWTNDLSFVWTEEGALDSGIAFKARQVVPADLQTANLVTFTRQEDALQFGKVTGAGAAGSLTIDCDGTIPKNVAMVGIGMSGAGTHVVGAEPNFAAVFTAHPQYWVGFGSYVAGQVLNVQAMVVTCQIEFPVNVYEMTATLDAGNNWTLAQGLV